MEISIFMNNLTAIDKSLLQGQITTVGELLKGLKSKVFSASPMESPVTLCTSGTGGMSEPLTIIYKCSNCNSLHFESGYFTEQPYDSGDIVYADKSNEVGKCVSRGELISLIEEEGFDMGSPVVIACSYDEQSYPMTMLIKCSDHCHATHILAYTKSEIIMN